MDELVDLKKSISKALLNHKKVKIIYESEGSFTQRTILPLKLADDCVEAYCYLRKSRRKFKLRQI